MQKNLTVEYLKDDKKTKSKGWFLVDRNNKQEFIVSSNSLVRVFCRSLIDDDNASNYTVKVYENGQWLANYMFDEVLTESQAKVLTDYKKIKNISLSKTRSFYLSVPYVEDIDYSYYSFSIPATASEDEKILIKIVEYENSNK